MQESSRPGGFPSDLAAVPEGDRIQEQFGWAPASWALACLCLAWLTLFQPAKLGGPEITLVAGLGLLALLLFIEETRRRKRPRVLVRAGHASEVGIYRDGRFLRGADIGESLVFLRHPLNTWGPLTLLVGVIATCGVVLKEGLAGPTLGERILPVLVMGFAASLGTSMVKTRLRCEEAMFPYPSSPGYERVLVPKAAISRIFAPRP